MANISSKNGSGSLCTILPLEDKATSTNKSEISQESWLIPGIVRFNRWFCMLAAFIIQFCCGSISSWSVFNKPIDTLIYGSEVNMAPITFYIAVGLLGLSAAMMGSWVERHGPKVASILGGFLFCAGNLLTAIAIDRRQMWLVFLGYGVVAGCGIGLCYISPVSTLQKWFPDRRGFASGIAVSGFGAGSIVSAKLEVFLIQQVGLSMTFSILGICYFFCILISGLVLRSPPLGFSTGANPNVPVNSVVLKQELTLTEALHSSDFRLMYAMFFSNVLFGLIANSRLSNMVTDIFSRDPEHASTIVAINGGFNVSGRILFPLLSDYIGRKYTFIILLTFQLILLSGFYFITTTRTYWLFLTVMWTIAACYGGGFGSIPAFLTDKFGPVNVGACHGVILTTWTLAAVVGGVGFTSVFHQASIGRDISDPFPYNVNVGWMLVIVVVGWSALMFVKPTEKDCEV